MNIRWSSRTLNRIPTTTLNFFPEPIGLIRAGFSSPSTRLQNSTHQHENERVRETSLQSGKGFCGYFLRGVLLFAHEGKGAELHRLFGIVSLVKVADDDDRNRLGLRIRF